MLIRSVGRRHHRNASRIIAASFAQLNLPWLAPAQVNWNPRRLLHDGQAKESRVRRRSPSDRRTREQQRHLATAAELSSTPTYDGGTVPPPFVNSPPKSVSDFDVRTDAKVDSQSTHTNLRPIDDPIIINRSLDHPVQYGIYGMVTDLLQHLHTSLRIGRKSRAVAIIHRLSEKCGPDSPELRYAHDAYIEESLRRLAAHGQGTKTNIEQMKEMTAWFEVEMRQRGIVTTRALIAMIRATIRSQNLPSKRDRAIRRYAELARGMGEEEHEEVLFSGEYDDNEFLVLGRATSTFTSEVEEDAVAAATESGQAQEPPATGLPPERADSIDVKSIPEVRPTPVRSLGLASVKSAVEAYLSLSALPDDAPEEARNARAVDRQLLLEQTSVDIALERWRREDEALKKIGINLAMQTKSLGAQMFRWHQAFVLELEKLTAEMRQESSTLKHNVNAQRSLHGQHLERLPLDRSAAIAILTTMNLVCGHKHDEHGSFTSDLKVSMLTAEIGRAVEEECDMIDSQNGQNPRKRKVQAIRLGANQSRREALRKFRGERKQSATAATQDQSLKLADSRSLQPDGWSIQTRSFVGALLLETLMKSAQVPVTRTHPRTGESVTQTQSAFLHKMRFDHGKRKGVVVPHPVLQDMLTKEPVGSVIAKRMPMIAEPKPWTEYESGGYLQYSTPIMRVPGVDNTSKDYFKAASDRGDLSQLYAGLNSLGNVAWNINRDVFMVQLEAWNTGDAIGNFPPLSPKFDIPPEPAPSCSVDERRTWFKQREEIENKRAGLHSKRCFQNFQLEIARSVINERLYLPHNVDFRGRAYPLPPYLNHMGADNVRALMIFAEGKELGPDGLRWLKIHLANVAGHDKISLQERLDFVMDHLDDIYDSVKDPLGGRRWWLESEDAWQTLAACFELTRALDSPDPTKFVSHLPIHQDGTCNGLQHYAALGGDKAGAMQVNLEPGDRPADVYSAVMHSVQEEVNRDAENGDDVAKALQGVISRKVVKQPVMTNVYGVTYYGAKEQVHKQLEAIFPNALTTDAVTLAQMSSYIAIKIFRSLGTMFKGAQEIQLWFAQCAERICSSLSQEQIEGLLAAKAREEGDAVKVRRKTRKADKAKTGRAEKRLVDIAPRGGYDSDRRMAKAARDVCNTPVVWTTPLRMPVVQPYRLTRFAAVTTPLQQIMMRDDRAWHPIDRRKQMRGFPPNFIHSLDATHMLMCAKKCTEVGLTFAAIHDCFWTHACDVSTLGVVLRDAFVAMHSDDVVGRLKEEFEARYKGRLYLQRVHNKSVAGIKILEWRAKHTAKGETITGELTLEHQRMNLLNSEDEDERRRGREMVTPGSIVEETLDTAELEASLDSSIERLGQLPTQKGKQAKDSGPEVEECGADGITSSTGGEEVGEEQDVYVPEVDVVQGPMTKAEHRRRRNLAHTTVNIQHIHVWATLKFPRVPAKGDFDVTRLRQSQYFFH